MQWPQIIVLIWLGLGAAAGILSDGSPRTGFHNGWASLSTTGMFVWLLAEGGFFR